MACLASMARKGYNLHVLESCSSPIIKRKPNFFIPLFIKYLSTNKSHEFFPFREQTETGQIKKDVA